MSNQPAGRTHPVTEFAAWMREELGELAGVPVGSMTPEEQRQALVDLTRLSSQLAALTSRMLADAERSGATADEGAGSTPGPSGSH